VVIELAENQTGDTITVTLQRSIEVRLDQFSDEAIIAYLRDRGYAVDGERKAPIVLRESVHVDDAGEVLVIDQPTLERITLLSLCGQRDAAREIVLELVRLHIGRAL
jgi:hypothetical protein